MKYGVVGVLLKSSPAAQSWSLSTAGVSGTGSCAAPKLIVGVAALKLGPEASTGLFSVLKVRNSFVGDMPKVGVDTERPGVPNAGFKVPLMLDSAFGSIDLRLLWPPRGTELVSTA